MVPRGAFVPGSLAVFAELLGRSCFSFLRGASLPEEMVEQARALELRALAICDRDGMYGAVRAWNHAREIGWMTGSIPARNGAPAVTRPQEGHPRTLAARLSATFRAKRTAPPFIVGAELTLDEGRLRPPGSAEADHAPTVALLVQTARGYENLCRLLTKSHEGRSKGECACSVEWFEQHAEGLVAVVPAPRLPAEEDFPASFEDVEGGWSGGSFGGIRLGFRDEWFEQLRAAFGDRAFLGMYRHLDGFDLERRRWVEAVSRRFGLSIVASARPLYHQPSRKPLADVVHCIRRGITLDEGGTELGGNGEAVLRTEAQMLKLFRDRPEWVERTAEVAQSVEFDLGQLQYHFPCELEEGQTADERLAELTWEGVGRRYPRGIPEKLRQQIKKELRLIQKIGVAPYFLSTRDVVEIARRRKILCQGRGSAANSAVCFVLGITAVDPARSSLLFERFLSEERAEPPDIDIDFEHERREEVIQEIYERYGRDRAAMVSEIISYRGKSALREVGKVFGFSLEQVDRLSSTITHWDGADVPEQRLTEMGFDVRDSRVRQVVALANQLQGFPRHLGIHVGGFVLSSRPLYEVAPVEPARMEGRTVIPWDKDDIEALGFFKVDVLGLGMLTAIRKALELIRQSGGLAAPGMAGEGTAAMQRSGKVPWSNRSPVFGAEAAGAEQSLEDFDPLEVITRIPPEDPAVYDMICRADTIGVFQIESRAQMAMLPRLRPRRFYDLVIEVAIVRPGPIQGGMVHPYLRRRSGEERVTSPHPELWPILERTLGVPLFQEQVMQISIVGAGYSGGEADQLRRDMAAWKKSGKLMRHKDRLLEGFAKKGISREFGEALFEQIKGFGDYGFPESHASSFALLVYASSWQKAHYPAHFACALINSQPMGFYQPGQIVRDAQRHGVEVRDICIMNSDWDCTLEMPHEGAPHEGAGETSVASTSGGAGASKERHGGGSRSRSPHLGTNRALRLGFRLVKGLGEATGRRISEVRREQPFTSFDDLVRRAELQKDEVEALAEAGALEALVAGRRQALWKARAPRVGGLFQSSDFVEPSVELPELRATEQLVLDYDRKGLSVGDHPMNHYRPRLRKQGVTRAADLLYLPKGTPVSVAGVVLSRQRPGTASGVVFITLEDETGLANLIVYSRVFEQYHHVARHSNLLLAFGEVERDEKLPVPRRPEADEVNAVGLPATSGDIGSVIHVIVRHLERLDGRGRSQRVNLRSRDFH